MSLIFFAAAASSQAGKAPDSINTIQANLPDSISLSGKVVYVDFWASWCTPCQHSFPWMQHMYDRYRGQGFEVIAVDVDKDHHAALNFLKDANVTFPIIFDSTGSLAKRYKLQAMPSTFVYSRKGHLIARNLGFRQEETDSLDFAIAQLLVREKKQ